MSSSSAVVRSSGFLTKQLDMKSLNVADHSSGFLRVGGGFVGIIKMALIGWISACGGRPSAISIQRIPNDHISAFVS